MNFLKQSLQHHFSASEPWGIISWNVSGPKKRSCQNLLFTPRGDAEDDIFLFTSKGSESSHFDLQALVYSPGACSTLDQSLQTKTADFRSFGGRKEKIILSISSGSKELSSATSNLPSFFTNVLLLLGDLGPQCNVATVAQKLPCCIIPRLILGPTVVKWKHGRQLV